MSHSHDHAHDHGGGHSHSHDGFNAAEHGHSHEILDGPGSYIGREMPIIEGREWKGRAFTVGIGGYVSNYQGPSLTRHAHFLRGTPPPTPSLLRGNPQG